MTRDVWYQAERRVRFLRPSQHLIRSSHLIVRLLFGELAMRTGRVHRCIERIYLFLGRSAQLKSSRRPFVRLEPRP